MKVKVLRASFYLHGCDSLKEKRHRLGRLRDKFGKQTALAVCESGHVDELRRGEWSFVAAAASAVVVQQVLADVEGYLATAIDAEILDLEQRWLV